MNSFQPTAQPAGAAPIRSPGSFGKRREPASIAITRNGRTTEYAISPIAAAFCFSVFAMFAVGYFVATAYLVLRDDLIGMTQARNARLLHEYEDRIATLRANLDRVTSRQLLDQQAIEARVAELMRRQEMLGGRSTRIGRLIEEARKRGLEAETSAPPSTPADPAPPLATDPLRTGSLEASAPLVASSDAFSLRGAADPVTAHAAPANVVPDLRDTLQTETLFTGVFDRIEAVDAAQRGLLDDLRRKASASTLRIAETLQGLGVGASEPATGGPFVPLEPGSAFDAHVEALAASLAAYDSASRRVAAIPVLAPIPGATVTSPFGPRSDPFLGRAAMHAGLDFRAEAGAPVRAAADGKVVDAGRNGGYGIMVEIDHGGGLTTRYAHLSGVTVKTGDKVSRGQTVGKVGSTGRSTGPHLHYEIRRNGDATDPARFLKAGRKLAGAI